MNADTNIKDPAAQGKSPRISVAVLAHNEAADLAALLATTSFADEVVVVDAASADETAAVARRAGALVIAADNDYNLNVNKTRAIEAGSGEWVIYLDPDERVPAELAAAIAGAVAAPGDCAGFEFPRRNNFFGRYLKHGGAFPDYQLRLFKRGRASFPCESVHERLRVEGRVGRLAPALRHETYPTVSSYLGKLPLYVAAGADYLRRRGVAVNLLSDVRYFLARPALRFLRRYVFKLGFLDGWPGLLACVLDAAQTMLAYYEFRSRGDR